MKVTLTFRRQPKHSTGCFFCLPAFGLRHLSFVLMTILGALSFHAGAADFRFVDESTIRIDGEFLRGDANRFHRMLLEDPVRFLKTTRVDVSSEGGLISEAREVAQIISETALMVKVHNEDVCASACFLLLSAAPIRLIAGDVLIHRPYFMPGSFGSRSTIEVNELQSQAMHQSAAFLRQHFVPEDLVNHLLRTPSNRAYKLSRTEIQQLGIVHPSWDEVIVANCGFSSQDVLDGLPEVNAECAHAFGLVARHEHLWNYVSPEAAIFAMYSITRIESPPVLSGDERSESEASAERVDPISQLWNDAITRAKHLGVHVDEPGEQSDQIGELFNVVLPELVRHGDAKSALQLGSLYSRFQDHRNAFRFRVIASQLGDRDALMFLSTHYRFGQGVTQDINKAFAYLYLGKDFGVDWASEAIEDLKQSVGVEANPYLKTFHSDEIRSYLPTKAQ